MQYFNGINKYLHEYSYTLLEQVVINGSCLFNLLLIVICHKLPSFLFGAQ